MGWTLRLVASAGAVTDWLRPERRLAGLNLPLRLALSAQAGGAERVELGLGAESCEALLKDARLRIAVVRDAGPEAPLVIEMPWNLVVHRDLPKRLAESRAQGLWRLPDRPFDHAPPFGFDPVLVVDQASARQAEKALLRSLRKPQDGWTSTYLNRYISLAITRLLARTPLRPNQLSVGILAIGLAGAVLAAMGQYWSMALGALLFQAQSVLDGCDGELSRVTYRGSRLGEWLDTVGDDLTNYGFFAGAAWGLYTASGSWMYLLAGVVILVCGLLTSGIEYRYLYRIGSGDLLKYPLGIGKASGGQEQKGSVARAIDAISPLFKRDTFVLLTLLGALLGLTGPFLIVFAIGGVGILVAVIKAELHMARTRKAGDVRAVG